MCYFQEMDSDERLHHSTIDDADDDDYVTVLPSASTHASLPQLQQQQQQQSPLQCREELVARTSYNTAQGYHSRTSLKRMFRRLRRHCAEHCCSAARITAPTTATLAITTTSTLLMSTVLLIAAPLRVISAQHATDIAWPTVQIDPNESTTLVPCYSDLRNASLNRFFRINSESVIIGAGCMVRIPTNVELMYRMKFHNKETFARILVGDKSKAPVAALAKIKQRDPLEQLSPFYGPIQVPCRYATLVLWKLGREDTFEFLMLGGGGGGSGSSAAAAALANPASSSGGGVSSSASNRQSATVNASLSLQQEPVPLPPPPPPSSHYHHPSQYTICAKLRKRKN